MARKLLLSFGAAAAALLLLVAVVLVIDAARKDVIADGVRIGSVDVGGLDREEARGLVQRELGGEVAKEVRALYKNERFLLRPEDARAELDVDASVDAALSLSRRGTNPFGRVLASQEATGTVMPRISVSSDAVERFVAQVARRVNRKARDADIDWRDGKLDRTPARNGVETRRSKLMDAVLERMKSSATEREVEVPVKVIDRPDRTLDDLAGRYPTVIAIDRDSQRLRLYENLKLKRKYRIAVGKAGHETDAGRYEIQEKQVDPPWHVPNAAWAGELAGQTIPPGDPRNALKARWMGFHDGQGIHGTDDISSLGETASHGCIRMAVRDVKELYDEVKKGAPVFVQ